MFKRIVIIAWFVVFFTTLLVSSVKSQSICVPREIVVTIGDNSPGNPMQSFTTELGCVENIYQNIDGYEYIGTPVFFSNVNYHPINGAIIKVTGNGIIVGYQVTKLIHTQGLLYIIEFDNGKQLRLHPFEFEVDDL